MTPSTSLVKGAGSPKNNINNRTKTTSTFSGMSSGQQIVRFEWMKHLYTFAPLPSLFFLSYRTPQFSNSFIWQYALQKFKPIDDCKNLFIQFQAKILFLYSPKTSENMVLYFQGVYKINIDLTQVDVIESWNFKIGILTISAWLTGKYYLLRWVT